VPKGVTKSLIIFSLLADSTSTDFSLAAVSAKFLALTASFFASAICLSLSCTTFKSCAVSDFFL
jgi:hypothetical protein